MPDAQQPAPALLVTSKRSSTGVLLSGLATTAATLFFLNLMKASFNPMGMYADYIIPTGAIYVGLAAGCGYGIASWFTGIRIRSSLMYTIVGLQVLAYCAAEYIQFLSLSLAYQNGTPVGFFEYFHYSTISMAWEEHGSVGAALGYWGYAVRLLAVAGFVGGSLILTGFLSKQPYCESCQMYMNKKQKALFPASVPIKKINKKDSAALAAHQTEQEEMLKKGLGHIDTLREFAGADNGNAINEYFNAVAPEKKAIGKLPNRIAVHLTTCKSCSNGYLTPVLLRGQGKQLQKTLLPIVALKPEVIRSAGLNA